MNLRKRERTVMFWRALFGRGKIECINNELPDAVNTEERTGSTVPTRSVTLGISSCSKISDTDCLQSSSVIADDVRHALRWKKLEGEL
jgi:hypothetical protein